MADRTQTLEEVGFFDRQRGAAQSQARDAELFIISVFVSIVQMVKS